MLYSNDIRDCNKFAQASADNLHRAAVFVLATIQQQLETVPVAMNDMLDRGVSSKYAWGAKPRGLAYLEAHKNELYSDAMVARDRPAALLEVFLVVPGMALVKAGFLCQIFAGHVGCIDLHNVKMYDVSRADVRYEPAKPETMLRKREQYVALCDGLGGAHALWSRWCDYVAALRPKNWASGADVSRFHFEVISGIETGGIVDLFSDVEYDPTFKQELTQ